MKHGRLKTKVIVVSNSSEDSQLETSLSKFFESENITSKQIVSITQSSVTYYYNGWATKTIITIVWEEI